MNPLAPFLSVTCDTLMFKLHHPECTSACRPPVPPETPSLGLRSPVCQYWLIFCLMSQMVHEPGHKCCRLSSRALKLDRTDVVANFSEEQPASSSASANTGGF